MICSLEERVCNLVLLWCITVIAHHCKLVKLQSAISDYSKQSDFWNYDDIVFVRPQNETNVRLMKIHNSESSYYKPTESRRPIQQRDTDDDPSLRARTNIDVPLSVKLNDGEVSVSKKITFNGNNSRSNNHPMWFNALEKSALSLPSFSFNNFKNLYGERKVESTKRPYEGPGSVFAVKPPIPLMNLTSNRNKIKYQQNYEPEYDEQSLPPSLPNLEIIPFVASDALDKPKDTPIDRKETIEYETEETALFNDTESQIKKFSPPVRTEGGFVPRDPSLDELYFKPEYNRTYSTSTTMPEITSEIRLTESNLRDKIEEMILESLEYSSTSTSTSTPKPTPLTGYSPTPEPMNETSTTISTPLNIHFVETTTKMASTLLKINSTTSSTATKREEHTTEEIAPQLEEKETTIEDTTEQEIPNKIPSTNNTKDENAEDDSYLLSNLLTYIFDDYPNNKEKTTTTKKPTRKPTTKPTPPLIKPNTTIPPFKHVYIPSTTTTNSPLPTVNSSKNMEFNSTKLVYNNNTLINEIQQNQIKYVSSQHSNEPITQVRTTPKPHDNVFQSHTQMQSGYGVSEIFNSMKTNNVISGLLKLSGCNIFGKMYKTGELIHELSDPCSRCICSEAGVNCVPVKC